MMKHGAVLESVALAVSLATMAQAETITVNSTADSAIAGDGECTLREAITNANLDADTTAGDCAAGSGDDVIVFSTPPASVIVLSSVLPDIASNIEITGPGAADLSVDGARSFRVFFVQADGTAIFDGLTVSGGSSSDGAGFHTQGDLTVTNCVINGNAGVGNGGGFFIALDSASLTIDKCIISENTASCYGGGICVLGGTINVTNCTLVDNSCVLSGAGIAVQSATINVTNCTLSGNSADGFGGGCCFIFDTVGAMTNVTMTGNIADADGSNGDGGGGFYLCADLSGDSCTSTRGINYSIQNTVITGNFDTPGNGGPGATSPDVFGPAFTSLGNNLIGDLTGSSGFSKSEELTVPPDQVLCLVLQDNGGPTPTHALVGASPAIDAGDDTAAPPQDQRGFGRNGTSDVGAFEFEGVSPFCPWDLDGSGIVGVSDLLSLLANWGPCKGCPADFDGNGTVDESDLAALLANWGPCR